MFREISDTERDENGKETLGSSSDLSVSPFQNSEFVISNNLQALKDENDIFEDSSNQKYNLNDGSFFNPLSSRKLGKVGVLTVTLGLLLGGCRIKGYEKFVKSVLKEEVPISSSLRQEEEPLEVDYRFLNPQIGSGKYENKFLLNEELEIGGENAEELIKEELLETENFDYRILDINEWNNYKLAEVESKRPGYVVTVKNPTSLFAIPLSQDGFLEVTAPGQSKIPEVEEIVVGEGISFEIVQTRTIKSSDNEEVKIGLIRNSNFSKDNYLYALLLSGKDSEGNEIRLVSGHEGSERIVSYISPIDTMNLRQVEGMMMALKGISLYQEENGPFEKGVNYSLLEFLELEDQGDYKKHFMEENDFTWIQENNSYIRIGVEIIPGQSSQQEEDQKDLSFSMVLSLSFVDEKPENQSQKLLNQLNEYLEILRMSPYLYIQEYGDFSSAKIKADSVHEALSLIYNRQELGVFEGLASENPVIKDILSLQDLVNNYKESYEQTLSQYIQSSDWYSNYMQRFENDEDEAKERAEYAIRAVDHIRIPGQPLQCVMYVALISNLYPELGVAYNIGGAIVTNDDGETRGVQTANELIPVQHRNLNGVASGLPSGGLLLAGENIGLDEYNPGDSFITLDEYGHIGIVLAKYRDEFGTQLLVTDSNRLRYLKVDGKVRIFTVKESEIDVVFGEHRYIITYRDSNSDISSFLVSNNKD